MATKKTKKQDPVFVDEYGCVYSTNLLELIHIPRELEYCYVRPGTKVIKRGAFDNFDVDDDGDCTLDHLSVVFLPDTIEIIEEHAFFENRSLGVIYIHIGQLDRFQSMLPPELVDRVVEVDGLEELIPQLSSLEETFEDNYGVVYTLDKTKLVSYPKDGPHVYKFPYKETTVICNDAFKGTNIRHLTIPETVEIIGNRAFLNSKIETIELPNSLYFLPDDIFYGCDSLFDIKLPQDLAIIGNDCFTGTEIVKLELGPKVRKILDYKFNEHLEEIRVDKKSKTFKTEDGILFSSNKKSLLRYPSNKSGETFNIPDSVQVIGTEAFSEVSNLKYVSASNVKIVESCAFWNCCSLNYVNLGPKLQTVGAGAFGKCWNLVSLYLPSGLKEFSSNALYSYYGGNISRCNIYTDNKSKLLKTNDLYNRPDGIKRFASIIHSDEQLFYQGIIDKPDIVHKTKSNQSCDTSKIISISFNKPVNGLWHHDFEYSLSKKRVFDTTQICAVYDFKNIIENLTVVKVPDCPKALVITTKYTVYLTNWNTIEEAKEALSKGGVLNNCVKTELGNLYMLSGPNDAIKAAKLIIPAITEIQRKDTLYKINRNGRYGLIDYKGDTILPCKYKTIDLFCGRYAIVSPKASVIDLFTGEELDKFSKYKEITPFGNYLIVRSRKNNLCHVVDLDGYGKRQFHPRTGKARSDSHYHIIPMGQGLIKIADKIDGEYLWGIIDNYGRELVPQKFKSISTIGCRSNYIWLNLNTEEKKYRLNISRLNWRTDWSHAIDMGDYGRYDEFYDDDDYSSRRSSYTESLLDACDGDWDAAMELEDRG